MAGKVFSIAPGVPFLRTFVAALLSGEIVEGLSRSSAPLEFARLSIYVPTRRAGAALAVEFARALAGGAAILPRILPLGALEQAENLALFATEVEAPDDILAPVVDEVERRLLLSELVLAWARALGHAVVSIDAEGAPTVDRSEPMLVAPTAANAVALAKDLGALIDEFAIENLDARALDALMEEAFDRYWAITRDFLRIALEKWPEILAERGAMDAAQRQKILVEAQIEELSTEMAEEPVIALGSTGSHPTTAKLLAAIAQRPRGAVILPGLDLDLDAVAWAHIGEALGEFGEPAFTHPQSTLKRLLRILRLERVDVAPVGAASSALAARRLLVSEALRPADATQNWRAFREKAAGAFDEALAEVSFVDAPDERAEALALALYMREALETPGRTAALITPDRVVARRVCAELRRFGVEVDDSAGAPLATSPIGVLARQVAAFAQAQAPSVDFAALLAHPLVALGRARAEIAQRAALFEIVVLRGVPEVYGDLTERVAEAKRRSKEAHPSSVAKRMNDARWREIAELAERLEKALAPLARLGFEEKLALRVAALRATIEALTRVPEVEESAAPFGVAEFLDLLDRLENSRSSLAFDARSFAAFLEQLMFDVALRGPRRAHPRLKILGPLEARLLDADLVLLAGLDENVWPPQAEAGAFLNRTMRERLGLTPPERRIGQSAHDFEMALGAKSVVLARAAKRQGSPTVVSRLIARIAALAGDAFSACKARGDAMLAIAAALDRPARVEACKRPEPRPPVELRPTKLSVTRIETLRRDPYSIYAERILRLAPLDRLGAPLGPREIGTAMHEALRLWSEPLGDEPQPEDALERLLALAQEELGPVFSDPGFRAFRWPRLRAGLEHALRFDAARRSLAKQIFVEKDGELSLTLTDGRQFRLSGTADRVEIDGEGLAYVFDYKTGTPPTAKQVLSGFAPQLTLEAAMIEAGAFLDIGEHPVGGAAYVRIGDAGDGEAIWIESKDESFADVVAEHRKQLVEFLSQFRGESRSYPSRPYVAFAGHEGDYDHLARVKEWSRGGGEAE